MESEQILKESEILSRTEEKAKIKHEEAQPEKSEKEIREVVQEKLKKMEAEQRYLHLYDFEGENIDAVLNILAQRGKEIEKQMDALDSYRDVNEIGPLDDELAKIRVTRTFLTFEKQIGDVEKFDDLIKTVKEFRGVIPGSSEIFWPDQLADIIDKVKNKKLSPDYITRNFGLRDKTMELLKTSNK